MADSPVLAHRTSPMDNFFLKTWIELLSALAAAQEELCDFDMLCVLSDGERYLDQKLLIRFGGRELLIAVNRVSVIQGQKFYHLVGDRRGAGMYSLPYLMNILKEELSARAGIVEISQE